MGFEIEGLEEFKQELLRMANEEFPVEKEKEMKKLGLMAESQIKPLIPVDTGRLRNSVFSHVIDNNTVEIVAPTDYASYVNNGFTVSKRFLPASYLDTPAGRKYLKDGNTKGIMLKPKFVKGAGFMEKGIQNVEPMIYAELDRWLNELFKVGE